MVHVPIAPIHNTIRQIHINYTNRSYKQAHHREHAGRAPLDRCGTLRCRSACAGRRSSQRARRAPAAGSVNAPDVLGSATPYLNPHTEAINCEKAVKCTAARARAASSLLCALLCMAPSRASAPPPARLDALVEFNFPPYLTLILTPIALRAYRSVQTASVHCCGHGCRHTSRLLWLWSSFPTARRAPPPGLECRRPSATTRGPPTCPRHVPSRLHRAPTSQRAHPHGACMLFMLHNSHPNTRRGSEALQPHQQPQLRHCAHPC